MTNLSDIVIKDLKEISSPDNLRDVYSATGKIIQDSIEQLNERGLDPDGSPRTPLSNDDGGGMYLGYADQKSQMGKNPIPDFDLTGTAKNSLDFDFNADKGISFSYNSSDAGQYMYLHENGLKGMPERRQFAVDRDAQSEPQKQVTEEIGVELEKLFNKPRTIHG